MPCSRSDSMVASISSVCESGVSVLAAADSLARRVLHGCGKPLLSGAIGSEQPSERRRGLQVAPCVYEFTKRGWLGSSSASSPPASGSGSHSGVSIGADSDRLSELRDGTRVMKLLDRRKEPAGVNEPRPAVAIVTASRGGLRQSGRVNLLRKVPLMKEIIPRSCAATVTLYLPVPALSSAFPVARVAPIRNRSQRALNSAWEPSSTGYFELEKCREKS